MANVTINNTSKSNWINYVWNDYFTNNTCTHKETFERIESIVAVDIIKVGGNECIEVMNQQDYPILLTNGTSSKFFQVDSVNGVAPSSLTDLRDKILALL